MYQTFEDFLKEIHARDYTGTDDDMPDAFEKWLAEYDVEEIMQYAEQYGKALFDRFNV